jgi:hypothetical protein
MLVPRPTRAHAPSTGPPRADDWPQLRRTTLLLL